MHANREIGALPRQIRAKQKNYAQKTRMCTKAKAFGTSLFQFHNSDIL
ncbi:hypothetical protein SD77_4076 [Bacillus badius]|uniref:Ribose 5-phosphate isomerase B n=1 Tax=Bacillus badius TaxID=1455 RepID=A0ABR5AUG6_BACBA|nr:hypothetical protein SD77_4076 [Bacillus badius]